MIDQDKNSYQAIRSDISEYFQTKDWVIDFTFVLLSLFFTFLLGYNNGLNATH